MSSHEGPAESRPTSSNSRLSEGGEAFGAGNDTVVDPSDRSGGSRDLRNDVDKAETDKASSIK